MRNIEKKNNNKEEAKSSNFLFQKSSKINSFGIDVTICVDM